MEAEESRHLRRSFQLPLSGSPLSLLDLDLLRLPLSTPSLGITAKGERMAGIVGYEDLSTPSLGITFVDTGERELMKIYLHFQLPLSGSL